MSHSPSTGHGRLSRFATLLLAATSLAAPAALAQPTGLGRFELERLVLNPNGQGSLSVGTGELLPHGGFRLSLLGHYENDPLVMYRDGDRVGSVVRDRVTAHLLASWAPLRWLELSAQVPVVAWQRGQDLSAQGVGAPAGAGLGTPTVYARLGLLAQAREAPLDLALELGAGLPLGSAEALARDGSIRLAPKLMVGRRFGALRAGVEGGILVRPAVVLGSGGAQPDELGNEVQLGAVLATMGTGLRGELNVRGLLPLSYQPKSLEVLAGLRLPLSERFELYALGGPGFGDTVGTPTFRVLLGLALVGGPRPGAVEAKDTDGDGVRDRDDRCPTEAGLAAHQGCPVRDTDQDGLADDQDKCPTEAGPANRQGCPVRDTDQDGLADDQDKCPTEAGPSNRQGCPVRDADKDGVVDERDACPSEPGLQELKGCPAKDSDKDTVADHLDNCPTEAGVVENQGCPAKQKQFVAIQKDKLEIKEQVFFATGKAAIQPRSFKMLDQVAKVLREHPEVDRMTIEGHTDNRGKAEANRTLSQSRAESVKKYLEGKGVENSRLEAKGFGPDQPIASNDTEKGRATNRRVEFIITTPERERKSPETP